MSLGGGSSSPSRPPPRVSTPVSEVTKAISLSVVTAIIGYISTSLIQLRAAQHTGRLERVNEQLKELYGPLLACVTASKSAYDAMVQQVGAATRLGLGLGLGSGSGSGLGLARPLGHTA